MRPRVRPGNRQRTPQCAPRIGPFDAELESHHEVDPGFRPFAQRRDDRCALLDAQPIGGEDRRQLRRLGTRDVTDFALLPSPLGDIVLSVAASREVTAKAHRYRAGHYLGDAGHHNQGARFQPTRERYGHSIGHANDDVANRLAGSKMMFDMGSLWHRGSKQKVAARFSAALVSRLAGWLPTSLRHLWMHTA